MKEERFQKLALNYRRKRRRYVGRATKRLYVEAEQAIPTPLKAKKIVNFGTMAAILKISLKDKIYHVSCYFPPNNIFFTLVMEVSSNY